MPDRAIAVILAVSLIANIGMGAFIIERHWYGLDVAEESSPVPPGPFPVPQYLNTPDQLRRSAFLQGPAVLTTVGYIRRGQVLYQETNETGTTMNISVEIVPGEGRVLVHTTPLMGIVFQEAANTAVNVSQGRTRNDLGGSDVIFSIESEGQISAVDGPSAGALMTIITEAAITGRPLWQNATLTGTINPDGSIGAIGGVLEKASAAKAAGKDLLLLPAANAGLLIQRESVRNFGGFQMVVRESERVSSKDYLQSSTGIRVEYVNTIEEVEQYLFRSG